MTPTPHAIEYRFGSPFGEGDDFSPAIDFFIHVAGPRNPAQIMLDVAGVLAVELSPETPGARSYLKVTFACDANGSAIGLDAAVAAAEECLREAEAFRIYVCGADFADAPKGAAFLHAGDGFVLCARKAETDGSDIGTSLHFLYDGERSVKWFDGPLSDQVRELVSAGDARRLHALVAKHVDLDPPSAAPRP